MAEEFPSNSNKLKEASLVRDGRAVSSESLDIPKTSEIESRPSGGSTNFARSRKVSTFKQVFAALFPDGIAGIKEHLIWDMFVPRMQMFLHDSWDDMGNAIFSPETKSRRGGSTVSYDAPYRTSQSSERPYRGRAAYDYEEKVFWTREEAERLRRTLDDILRRHKVVTLLDYNEEVGYPTSPGQTQYGWINLDSARIERTFDRKWVLVMPRPVEIYS